MTTEVGKPLREEESKKKGGESEIMEDFFVQWKPFEGRKEEHAS